MYKRNNVIAIVQARMGSERLPGKVLMDIVGRPMLWHVVNRIKYAKYIDKLVIATTTNKKDDVIEDFCKKYALDFYRGSEGDVLDRYYQTAKKYQVDVVVRITSDCPLIDPEVVDKVVAFYLKNRDIVDYASNSLKRSYPRGLDTEVFSFEVLKKTWQEANKLYQREHVTPYIYEHPEIFRLANVNNDEDLSYVRWTVDEKKDLEFVREIYKRLYKNGEIFLMKHILALFKKEPQILDINKEVKQKALKA